MVIRRLLNEEIPQACKLAGDIYDVAIRHSFHGAQSNGFFDEYADADRLCEEAAHGQLFAWGACEGDMLVGMCAMTAAGHITMLYVHPSYLKKGIGKKLLRKARIFARMELKLDMVSVNAIPAYTAGYFRKAGFTDVYTGQNVDQAYIPLCAKSIHQIEYEHRSIPRNVFFGVTVAFAGVVFVSGMIYSVIAALTP